MKRKWLLLFTLGIGIIILSGCNEAEEILGKVNQILDQQLEGSESDEQLNEEVNQVEEESNENVMDDSTDDESASIGSEISDGHENEADPMLSFDERLQKAGYAKIDPPNGLRLPLPLDWVLVQVIKEDPWEGVFCFDTQLEETIAKTEEDFRAMGMDVISDPVTVDSDNKHSTKYYYKDANETMEGDIIYFVDNYGTTCGKVYLVIDFG